MPGGKLRADAPRRDDPEGQQDLNVLLERANGGDREAMALAFELHRGQLRRVLNAHMDWRLMIRLDADDVLQDTYIEAEKKLAEYWQTRQVTFFVWLRGIAVQRLSQLYRFHLAGMRDVNLEQPIAPPGSTGSRSVRGIAFVDSGTSPSGPTLLAERREKVRRALAELQEPDREVLICLYFEGLKGPEAALALGITEAAFRKRHERALWRFKGILDRQGGSSSTSGTPGP